MDKEQTNSHGLQGDIEEFTRIVSAYNYDIAAQGRLGYFSGHKVAENVCMRLLNALYGWKLVNKNAPGYNEEAIDLLDDKNRLVVQVTATCSPAKINSTLGSDRAEEYYKRGYRLKFAFVGDQHGASKVQGTGKGAWTLHNPHGDSFFNRVTDALFTADLVDRFSELESALRMDVLERVRSDIGEVRYKEIREMPICRGYGRKEGICTNNVINQNISYCEECYAERFMDSVMDLFTQQGYVVVDRIGNILCLQKEEWIAPIKIAVITHARPNESLSKPGLYELMDQLEGLSPDFVQAQRVLVLDNAQGLDSGVEMLARKLHLTVRYQDVLERDVLDLKPYERHVEDCYKKNHMSDYVSLRARGTHDDLKDVVFEFLSRAVGSDDDGSTRCRLLLGDFGVGKTSFCYCLAYDMIQYARKESWTAHGYYPVVVRLRDLNSDRSLDKLITSAFVNDFGVARFTLETFKRYLSNNRVLMIFDGFDEITKRLTVDAKYDVYKAICAYAIGETKIIVTCRPNFFQTKEEMERLFKETPMYFEPQRVTSLKFEEIEIDEFGDDQIREYLHHKGEQLKKAGLDADSFLDEMRRIHDLSDLARRPVLLEMILETLSDILEARRDDSSEAGRRVSAAFLYKQYTSKWIEREIGKGRTLFSSAHKADFCTFMAFRMFGEGISSIPMEEIADRIQTQYAALTLEDIEAYAHEIRSGSFFISNGDGTFGFVHRSFMEYFVARELIRMLASGSYTLEQCIGSQLFSIEIGRFAADILREEKPEAKRYVTDRLKEAIDGHGQEMRYNAILLLSKIGEGASLFVGEQKHFEQFDLANIELEHTTISGCFFSSASFARAMLNDVTFANCSLESVDLSDAIIRNCTFVDVDADGSRWSGSDVSQSKFLNVWLTDTNFNNARVHDCDFDRTDMSGLETRESEFWHNYISDDVYGVPYDVG